MNSHLTQEQLNAYVDGTLTLEEMRSIDDHLDTCAMCRDALDTERRIHQHVAQSLSSHLNSQHPSKRMHFTHIGRAMRESQQPQPMSPRIQTVLTVAAAALLCIIAGAAITFVALHPASEHTASTTPSAQDTQPGGKTPPLPIFAQDLQPLPDGWKAVTPQNQHIVGMSPNQGRNGGAAGVITSTTPNPAGFGATMQAISAQPYRGKRLRLQGYLSTLNTAGKAGLWMRVDHGSDVLAFDNMDKRPIQGTTPWRPYHVVLDVPPNADRIVFGALLIGGGTLRFDDASLSVVDTTVPTTAPEHNALNHPINLDFEGTTLP
ncbi:MAG: zf-HC2 domain-containing protein [Myxococcota bacterium]